MTVLVNNPETYFSLIQLKNIQFALYLSYLPLFRSLPHHKANPLLNFEMNPVFSHKLLNSTLWISIRQINNLPLNIFYGHIVYIGAVCQHPESQLALAAHILPLHFLYFLWYYFKDIILRVYHFMFRLRVVTFSWSSYFRWLLNVSRSIIVFLSK